MDTTKANVLLIAPDLSTADTTLFDLVLADVAAEITTSRVCTAQQEAIQRYLVAHIMTRITGLGLSGANAGAGEVEREKVDDIEIEYRGAGGETDWALLQTTKYGSEYYRLYLQFRLLQSV